MAPPNPAGGQIRVLLLHTHPVQYLTPLFRAYARRDEIDLTVAYCVPPPDGGLFDPAFGVRTDWGIDLTDGYRHQVLRRPLRRFPRFNPDVMALIRSGGFDVVVCYGYNFPTAWLSLLASKRSGPKWGFLSDSHALSGRRIPGAVRLLFVRRVAGVADFVIAASHRSVDFYQRHGARRVFFVPHAIDNERFEQAAEDARARVKDGNTTIFLFVGKLVRNKRADDLIRAAALLGGVELWFAGSGVEEPRLRCLAERLSVTARFLGFVNQRDLPSVYASADVLVLPSEKETFGLVVSEGAAVGLPAIVTETCGVVDSLVIGEESGLVVPPKDIGALSNAMRRMQDPQFRLERRMDMARIAVDWSLKSNVDAFVHCVEELASTA